MKRIRDLAGRAVLLALLAVLVLGAVNTASAGWATISMKKKLLEQRQGGELYVKLTDVLGEPTILRAEDSDEPLGVKFSDVTAEEAAAAMSLLADEEKRIQAGVASMEYDFVSGELTVCGKMDLWYVQILREERMQQRTEEEAIEEVLGELEKELSKQVADALQGDHAEFKFE